MGFGVPAAIGAKIANPDKEVVLFVGDGGFQMTNQELAILNIYKVPIKVVMLNNHSLGMVRQWQEAFYDGRTSESVFDSLPDFQLMAQAYGIKNYKFDNPETLETVSYTHLLHGSFIREKKGFLQKVSHSSDFYSNGRA